ncbi:hypothetical protein [Halalkalibacter sp. APA_J-10(15)]|uniref:hypothetical protein n=1 Tax=Halalkalibacter sp. APA_J-10(15) TaxID=2933805 RepID=UPI001FF14F82|nr:hypothetical protein [Halalkalibacter sp. APA_J-10(15)]MCK0471784.1 hypothetical protein [Halalkalibacter sp. APA_J-10(15)]
MLKKVMMVFVSVIVLGIVSGCSIIHTINGNVGLMEDYLEDTNGMTDKYVNLQIQSEQAFETAEFEEDVVVYTEETFIPTLEQLVVESEEYGEQIDNERLQEIHQLYTQSLQIELDAEYQWLIDLDPDQYMDTILEAREIDDQFVEQLEELAGEWGMEIEWEYYDL